MPPHRAPPKTTLALVHCPFQPVRARTASDDLYQLWAEPAVQDFLQRPRSKIPAPEGLGPTVQECESLEMKDAFIAVLTIEHSAWKIVGGFRFKGDPGNAEQIVANWKAKLLGTAPEQETVEHRGINSGGHSGIVSLSPSGTVKGSFARNDPNKKNPLMDRVDGRGKDPATAGQRCVLPRPPAQPRSKQPGPLPGDRLVEKLMPLRWARALESAIK